VAAVAAAGAVTAALAVAATDASASPGAAPAASAMAAAPRVPQLSWTACDGGFQCTTARVPLDYQHPQGATISIAVIRHLATDPAHRVGTLFVNGGGPSVQVESYPAEYPAIPAALRARFDIVTFDMRGFGLSTAVQCFPTAAAENEALAGLPTGFPVGARQVATWEKTFARFDAACARDGGGLLQHDTSTDVARDMNLLRQAMGIRKLNYIGLSYATGLGADYANLFPATIGHMVLDGNLDPVAWAEGGSLPDHLREGEDLASASVMRSFLGLCGSASTAACAFSAGTPAATQAKFATLLNRLLKHPVTIGTPPQTVTYAETINDLPPSQVSDWPSIAVLLQRLWAASAVKQAPAVASPAAPRTGAHSTANNGTAAPDTPYIGQEQQFAEYCADTAGPYSTRAYEAAARLAGARSGGFGVDLTWSDEPCAAWPADASTDRYTGPWNRRTASPILVIGNTGDPNTPYRDAVAMSRDLARARLLTVNEFGHTEFGNPDACATSYEISYLTTGALPRAGTVCQADAPPFPAP
jgi:pimeloyl-ACP methyl ester carboxylesterase